jgi:hypothetical protein
MTGIALVTSIYGDYDTLEDPPEQDGVDEYIAVVDRPYDGCSLWRQVIEPRPHQHPRLAAKVAKCRPDLYTDAPFTVWIDGSARLRHQGVAFWAAAHLGEPIAQFVHPERDDFHAEAEVSAGIEKYKGQTCLEQAGTYRKDGMPDKFGLWATGLIVRNHQALPVRFGNQWLVEQLRWTYQDQISEPYLLWRNGIDVSPLPGYLWNNDHVGFGAHASHL